MNEIQPGTLIEAPLRQSYAQGTRDLRLGYPSVPRGNVTARSAGYIPDLGNVSLVWVERPTKPLL